MNYTHSQLRKDFEFVKIFLENQDVKYLPYLIDLTLLKPQVQEQSILELCQQVMQFSFRTVCIPPCYVELAAKTNVPVCTVIGFPNGYHTTKSKVFEVKQALENGVCEIDFVQNISFVKSKNFSALKEEFLALVEAAQSNEKCALVKVILETSLLTDEEIYYCTQLAAESGIHIIKTSTGFGERGASLKDIEIIKKALDEYFKKSHIRLGIKASGGIRNFQDALSFILAGATCLGTSNGKIILMEK